MLPHAYDFNLFLISHNYEQIQLKKFQYYFLGLQAKRIENGMYLGPIGYLTFEGKLSWKNRILAFIFEYINVKIGPFNPIQIRLNKEEREPTTKDPFFVWFYVDEEIAVAQGRGGGIAFWCRCRRIT